MKRDPNLNTDSTGRIWYNKKDHTIADCPFFSEKSLMVSFQKFYKESITGNNKISFQFSCFESHDKFIDYYMCIEPAFKQFFECIHINGWRKFPLDIDFNKNLVKDKNLSNEDIDNIVYKIVSLLFEVFFESSESGGLNIKFDTEEKLEHFKSKCINIYTSHSETKRSYHIITKIATENHIDASHIFLLLGKKLRLHDLGYLLDLNLLDKGVYKSFQNFRILESHKVGQIDRPKIFQRHFYLNGKRIDYIYPENVVTDNDKLRHDLLESFITYITPDVILIPSGGIPKFLDESINVREKNTVILKERKYKVINSQDSIINDEIANQMFDLLSSEDKISFNIQSIKANMVRLRRLHSTYCECHDRYHDNMNPFLYVAPNGTIFFNCARPDAENKYIGLLNLPDDIKLKLKEHMGFDDKISKKLSDSFIGNIKSDKYTKDIFERKYINEDKHGLYPFYKDHDVIILKSSMGSGKTHSVSNYIKSVLILNPKIRCLVVSTRRAYANNIHHILNSAGLKFINYVDTFDEKDLNHYNLLICSLESIHKLSHIYDIVIMDEATSVTKQMQSIKTHGRFLYVNKVTFENLCKFSTKLILIDADIDIRSKVFIQSVKPDSNVFYAKNKMVRGDYVKYKIMETDTALWFRKIKLFLKAGKKLHIIVTSARMGRTIERFIKRLKFNVIYFHQKGDDNKDIIKNINEQIINYDVLMHTSTINVGIDINVEYFHAQFIYCNNKSNCVREVKQMMGRVRYLIDMEIFVTFDITRQNKPRTFQEIKFKLEESRRTLGVNANNDKYFEGILFEQIVENSILTWVVSDTFWNKLWILNELEKNISCNDYCTEFWSMIEKEKFIRIDIGERSNPEDLIHVMEMLHKLKKDCKDDDINVLNKVIDSLKIIDIDTTKGNFDFTESLKKTEERAISLSQRKDLEVKIKSGEATSDDKLKYEFFKFKDEVLPIYHDEINSKMVYDYYVVKDSYGHNVVDLVKNYFFEISERLSEDEKFNSQKGHIKVITDTLKIKNTYDTDTYIIKDNLEILALKLYNATINRITNTYVNDVRIMFNIDKKNDKTIPQKQLVSTVLRFLNQSLFPRWSGSKIIPVKKNKHGSIELYRIYIDESHAWLKDRLKNRLSLITVPNLLEVLPPQLNSINAPIHLNGLSELLKR